VHNEGARVPAHGRRPPAAGFGSDLIYRAGDLGRWIWPVG
jgi:hypothetical protein